MRTGNQSEEDGELQRGKGFFLFNWFLKWIYLKTLKINLFMGSININYNIALSHYDHTCKTIHNSDNGGNDIKINVRSWPSAL